MSQGTLRALDIPFNIYGLGGDNKKKEERKKASLHYASDYVTHTHVTKGLSYQARSESPASFFFVFQQQEKSPN